jgi:hypothetical protein
MYFVGEFFPGKRRVEWKLMCVFWLDRATFIGKRHVLLFRAARDIEEGEELCFNYGPAYFDAAELRCGCTAFDTPHTPGRL